MDLDIHWVLIFQLLCYCSAQVNYFINYNDDGDFFSTFWETKAFQPSSPKTISDFSRNFLSSHPKTWLVYKTKLDGLGKPSLCGITPDRCTKTPYRSFDGSCNNLKNPSWGTPYTAYNRLLPSKYADGIKKPATSISGKPLPLARSLSLLLSPDVPIEDSMFNLNLMQYGQIVTHDMSKTLGTSQTERDKIKCCSKDGQLLEENIPGVRTTDCYPMLIPRDDPAHSQDDYKCTNYHRTVTNRDRNCSVGNSNNTEQLSSVNHYLDLSIVYGNNDEINRQLREFKGGRLLTEFRHGLHWPPRPNDTSATCRPAKPQDACYFAGDTRVNQSPQLTLLQIILLREHNRISEILFRLNPHWDDERLFQEARKINIAEHQHITYYEWLPHYIGKETALKHKLNWNTDDFVNDYNESIDVSVLNEHATGAFKHFHNLIRGTLDLVAENGYTIKTIRFTDIWRRPQVLEEENGMDDLIRGLTTQAQLASNQFFDKEMTQFLFKPENATFGGDLKALDIQRSRDHGLASYNDYRELFRMPRAKKFEDFSDYINHENVKQLASLYENPDDVDLMVGGSLENNVPGTLVGPTFLGILVEQFYRTRVGDRFWFENSANGFNLQQLTEIRKSSISRLLCDNGHNIKKMQPRGFEKLSVNNSLRSCHSLPSIDFSLWRDNSIQPDSDSE